MKQILILSSALFALGLSSCRKDYYCDCKKIYTGSTSSESVNDGTYTFNDSRPRAEDKCNQQETTGTDVIGAYSRECEIR